MLFRKSKQNAIAQDGIEKEKDNNTSIRMATTLKREIRHTKSIINGKLYDTEKSTKICGTKDHRLLFATSKGNYFSCDTDNDEYIQLGKDVIYQVFAIIYSDIRPETEQYARENIGMYDVEKYIELFGEAEEA